MQNLQPIQLPVVSKFENELVNYSVNSNRSTNQLQFGICGVVEYEVVAIEVC